MNKAIIIGGVVGGVTGVLLILLLVILILARVNYGYKHQDYPCQPEPEGKLHLYTLWHPTQVVLIMCTNNIVSVCGSVLLLLNCVHLVPSTPR